MKIYSDQENLENLVESTLHVAAKVPNVQVSDTRGDAICTTARHIK